MSARRTRLSCKHTWKAQKREPEHEERCTFCGHAHHNWAHARAVAEAGWKSKELARLNRDRMAAGFAPLIELPAPLMRKGA